MEKIKESKETMERRLDLLFFIACGYIIFLVGFFVGIIATITFQH